MKTTQQVYAEYKIMPSLQLHQLRVAAVAKLICESFEKPIKVRDVVLACLFHDMGNIIKSDLSYFPDFCEPEGLTYWEEVKAQFTLKYGSNHHGANVAIGKEIGLPQDVVVLIDSISFSKLADVVADSSYERKVMQYADVRVGPHGVLALKERLLEGRDRYIATRKERRYYETDNGFNSLYRAAEELEKQVFTFVDIAPGDITDKRILNNVEELREYQVR